jgi:acetylornithine deacetylase/succinyl-diaminopimelate desuccinylase-like protein
LPEALSLEIRDLSAVKGISHSPKEFTSAQDMANGASVLLRTVLEIDGGALE